MYRIMTHKNQFTLLNINMKNIWYKDLHYIFAYYVYKKTKFYFLKKFRV